jgi:hypothetical protein
MSENKTSVGEQVYSGMAEYGKIQAGISIVVTSVIAIIMLGIGIYLLRRKDTYTNQTTGKITKAACVTKSGNSTRQFDCNLTVEIIVNSQTYTIDNLTIISGTEYIPGKTITVYYNPENPNEAALSKTSKWWGWGLIIVALLMIIFVVVNFWLTTKYKGYAAFQGASSVAGAFGGGSRAPTSSDGSGPSINLGNLGFN